MKFKNKIKLKKKKKKKIKKIILKKKNKDEGNIIIDLRKELQNEINYLLGKLESEV